MAQDAVYHSKCLASLYKKADIENRSDHEDSKETKLHGRVLAELIAYIEDAKAESEDIAPIFKLADLARMYSSRMEQLGGEVTGRMHTTKLKHRILANFPDMQAHQNG